MKWHAAYSNLQSSRANQVCGKDQDLDVEIKELLLWNCMISRANVIVQPYDTYDVKVLKAWWLQIKMVLMGSDTGTVFGGNNQPGVLRTNVRDQNTNYTGPNSITYLDSNGRVSP